MRDSVMLHLVLLLYAMPAGNTFECLASAGWRVTCVKVITGICYLCAQSPFALGLIADTLGDDQ